MWHQQIMIESVPRLSPTVLSGDCQRQREMKWMANVCLVPSPIPPSTPAREWQAAIRDMKIKGNKSFKWLQLNFWRF